MCLVGCAGMQIDEAAHTLRIGETTLHEGELLTLDGTAGAVYTGAVHTVIEPMADLRARLKQLRTAQGKVAKVVKARKAVKMPKAAAS